MQGSSLELKSRILKAGAGAGKTTTLVRTFLDFCADGLRRGETPRIVITTFTRKATQEVRERLTRGALERLLDARAKNDDAAAKLAQQTLDLLGQRSRVHISTIHGILAVFLARTGPAAGRSPDFRILSSDDLERRRKRELYRLLKDSDEFAELRLEFGFREISRFLADALDAKALRPELRFLSRDEMRDAVLSELGDLGAQALDLAAILENVSGLSDSWSAWKDELKTFRAPKDEKDLAAFIAALAARKAPTKGRRAKTLPDGFFEDYELWHERFKRFTAAGTVHLADPSYWERHERLNSMFEKLLAVFAERWDAITLKEGLFGMGDLETQSLRRLREHPALGKNFARGWDYWMIDEYQDTSPLQVELLKHLIGDRPHFIVGDPQQSIYAFRGARSEVFDWKFKEFAEGGHRADIEPANRRSRAPLLGFINDVFSARPGFGSMEAKSTKPAWPESVPAAEFRKIEPVLSDAGQIEKNAATTVAVVEKIVELLEQGAPPESICVLSRSNRPLKDLLAACRQAGVPVQIHSSAGFSERREVRDALAFLRFLLNPSDNLNLLVLLRSPWFLCPDDELVQLGQARENSYWQTAKKLFSARETHPVNRLQTWLDRACREGLARCLGSFYRIEGVLDWTEKIDPSGRREANLWKILSLLEQDQRRPGFNGLLFVETLGQMLGTEESVDDSDAVPAVEPKRVNLMTVHASKGLEFDHVLIPYLDRKPQGERRTPWSFDEERAVWSLAPKDDDDGFLYSSLATQLRDARKARSQAESARVLYVAMTRARQTLTFFWEDDEPPAGTWAEEFAAWVRDDGVQKREGYIFSVRRDPPKELRWSGAVGETKAYPGPWKGDWETAKQSVSPTELLDQKGGGAKDDAATAVEKLKFAQRGTDAHRLFESLKYADAEAVRAMTEEAELRDAVSFVETLKEPPLLEIIQNGHVEWGFAVRRDGKPKLMGQVDLWGTADDDVWIIDYKTGSMFYVDKAFDQMKIYAWALMKMGYWKENQKLGISAVYPMDRKAKTEVFLGWKSLRSDWERLGLS